MLLDSKFYAAPGFINALGHLQIKFAPVDVFSFERIVQNLLAGVAEHADGLAGKHANRGNVDPSP